MNKFLSCEREFLNNLVAASTGRDGVNFAVGSLKNNTMERTYHIAFSMKTPTGFETYGTFDRESGSETSC